MATNPSTLPENSGRITAADANYTYGSAKDDSTGTTGDGTPIKQSWMNDIYGFQQWLLTQANIVPSGSSETILVSQFGQAMVELNGGVGSVIQRAVSAVPEGFFECDGSAVSRTTYAELFAIIGTLYGVGDGSTTFNIPDLRGEFIRGWDNGRGVDPARAIGSAQGDQFEVHTHELNTRNVYDTTAGGSADAAAAGTPSGSFTGATGGTETRPRNVALMFCIKF